jgi:DNA modification methylase
MNPITVKISEVKSNPNNPRIIKDDKFQKLVKSIKEFPEMLNIRPIVVNADMVVLGGNMRLKACKEAGLKEVAIIKAEDLTEDQQKQFIIKDNVGFGEWDWEDLANNWDAEQLTDWGLDIPDFKPEVLEAEEDEFDVPDGGIDTDIVLGDLFEIGEHRLLCGDSTSIDDVNKLVNGEKIDLVYTDPPYGINEETDRVEHVKTFKKQGIAKKGKYEKIIGDDSIQTALDAFIICETITDTIVYWGGNYYAGSLPSSSCWLVWDKRIDDKQRDLNSDCELAYIKHPHKKSVRIFRHLWKGMIKGSEKNEKRCHPTQKPVLLADWCMNEYSPQGKTVADLFLGSGATMIAAHQIKRVCYGLEMSPKYCQVIVDRMMKLDPTLEVKRNGIKYIKTTE